MNKCTCILFLACFFCLPYAHAQKSTGIEKNSLYLSPGIGVFSVYPALNGGSPEYRDYTLKVPLLSLSLDVALTRHWSVGPYLAYSATGHDTIPNYAPFASSGYEFKRYEHFQFGSKTAYYFHVLHRLAGYTGIIIGYERTTHTEPNNTNHAGGAIYLYNENPRHLFLNVFVGARMPVWKKVTVFAEAGSYVTFLKLGCSVKLN